MYHFTCYQKLVHPSLKPMFYLPQLVVFTPLCTDCIIWHILHSAGFSKSLPTASKWQLPSQTIVACLYWETVLATTKPTQDCLCLLEFSSMNEQKLCGARLGGCMCHLLSRLYQTAHFSRVSPWTIMWHHMLNQCSYGWKIVKFSCKFPYLRMENSELFMAALCNRAGHIYCHPVVCSSFFLFFPRLISAVGHWMSAILPHMVWPSVRPIMILDIGHIGINPRYRQSAAIAHRYPMCVI